MQQSVSRCAIFWEIEANPELESKQVIVGEAQSKIFLRQLLQ